MRLALLLLLALSGRTIAANVEIVCVDGSKLRAKLLDEKIEVKTKYGTLAIPADDVHRVTFALRLTPAEVKRIDDLVVGLGSTDFDTREKAMESLRDLRERAYPALVKASMSADAEVARRAAESVNWLQARVHASVLLWPTVDTVRTHDGCEIRGTIAVPSLRIQTAMFGEQALRLSDARQLDAVAKPK